MAGIIKNVAIIGATGQLGSRIAAALKASGFAVTAVQRKDSDKTPADGIKSVKVNLTNKGELIEAFQGHQAVISAVPSPHFATEQVWIDAALETPGVQRLLPSEFSTNLESPLAEGLPIVTDKVHVRRYLTSKLGQAADPGTATATATATTSSSSTWTGVNNGPFFPMIFQYGALGPNFQTKKATFRNGGDNLIGVSRLEDIGTAIAKVLSDEHLAATANQPVYIHSVAVTERQLTKVASKVTGIAFEEVHVRTEDLHKAAMDKWAKGDKSGMFDLYMVMMYQKGYGGSEDFQKLSWNERLGLKTLSDADIEEVVKATAKHAGVLK